MRMCSLLWSALALGPTHWAQDVGSLFSLASQTIHCSSCHLETKCLDNHDSLKQVLLPTFTPHTANIPAGLKLDTPASSFTNLLSCINL